MGADLLQELDLITPRLFPACGDGGSRVRNRRGLELLCCYVARPALALGRLRVLDAKHLLDGAPINVVN